MQLIEVVRRMPVPEPWAEGDTIPWNEPGFSARMLKEHFNQDYDAASRRTEKIEQQVSWIHGQVLAGRATRILDLGCGPGLYAARLASLGHTCAGIDFSPASIAFAVQQAHPDCTFRCEDIRSADYGVGYGLAMLIYGEFNVFKPSDVHHLLDKMCAALQPGGLLLLEPGTYAYTERSGRQPSTWYSSPGGLFSAQPHLVLEERFWDAARRSATKRFFVVDAESAEVTRFAASYQAYQLDELTDLLQQHGFGDITTYPSLTGEIDPSQADLFALVARKRQAGA